MHGTIDIPRLVIAGTFTQRRAGKTTISTALMAALHRRGKKVQPFKAGPDFIDPSFHRAATGRPSRNLDGWMLTRDQNLEIFACSTAGADIAILEGVMGLFDGRDGTSDAGSTAELAKWLNAPVVLIVDGSAMARSAAALVHGFESFDPGLNLAGVLFNHLAGKSHFDKDPLRSIENSCRAIPLGFLASNPAIAFPDRHLGLLLAGEFLTEARVEALSDWIESSLDLDRLLQLAASAPKIEIEIPESTPAKPRARIGIARDRAFLLPSLPGANLSTSSQIMPSWSNSSPLEDRALPENLTALYLGGGYPELHASALSHNFSMLDSIRAFARDGHPVYAECGGFMYLCESIVDLDGVSHSMAGIFPTVTRMRTKLAALWLRRIEIEQITGNHWLRAGERIRGHQFRYSDIDEMPPQIARNYRTQTARLEGYSAGSVLGSYIHLHFASCPDFAARFAQSTK